MRRSANVRFSVFAGFLLFVGLAAGAAAQCEYKTSVHYRQQASKHTRGHKTGKHKGQIKAKFTCQCDHTCRSNCNVEWNGETTCEDTGRIKGAKLHRVYSEERIKSGAKANAVNRSGAICGAGLGCFVEECYPLFCSGISITVRGEPLGVGAGFKFEPTPQPYWGATLEIPFECDGCWESEVVSDELRRIGQEYVPIDEGGHNSIGPVYEMCYWECQSWLNSQGVYEEYCEVKECLLF